MKTKETGAGMKKVLMIVEDYDSIRNLAGRYFQVDGYEVISAGNMHEAITIGEREQPCMIIVDFDMSNDSYVIVQMLHNTLPMSKILIVNGRNRHCNTNEVKTAGADGVLERNFSPSVLQEFIQGQFATR